MVNKSHIIFNLTGRAFDSVDFSEAVIGLEVPQVLPDPFDVLVYGAIWYGLDTLEHGYPDLKKKVPEIWTLAGNEGIYIGGWSRLRFLKPKSGVIDVSVYAPAFGWKLGEFLRDGKEIVTVSKNWEEADSERGTKYIIDSYMEHPLGYMRLDLLVSGSVTLTVSIHDIIPLKVYEEKPESVCFDRLRIRQLKHFNNF